MVCSTAILSSSLALSLLRHSSPPSKSFVLSPYSLNTALAIVHDGAGGETQKELTELLLKGCTPDDVTALYSSLAFSLPATNETGVAFKSANRFYVDPTISLKTDYQKHVESKYKAKVQNLDLTAKKAAAAEINKFVEGATNNKIKEIVKPEGISDEAKAMLVNAIHFLGKWQHPFKSYSTISGFFKGEKMNREIEFMNQYKGLHLRASKNTELGTVLIMPYKDAKFNFFYLMPKETSNLGKLRNALTGEKLVNMLKNTKESLVTISVPKFKVESELDPVDNLKKLGVNRVFDEHLADLSKVSSLPLFVSKITHKAVVETDEDGTEAAAATVVEISLESAMVGPDPEHIVIDRPFLFGIAMNDQIIFIGQYV